jgi:tetratricopeptide (TPR) repeat protein
MDLEHPGPSHRRAARLLLADLLLERGEVDASESILLDESANNRDDPRICYQLGAIAMSRNELEKAERFLRTAMTSPSSRKKAGALLAVLARRQGDEAKSQLLEKAAADFPGDLPWPNPYFDDLSNFAAGSEARSRQAEMFEAQGRLDEALRIYLGLTRTHPTQRNFVRAALIFAKLNDSVNTEAYLKSSLEFDPKQAHIHYFLAQMFYLRAERLWSNESERVQARQLLEESLKYAAQATELKAHFGQCDVVAGRAYLLMGKNAEAVQQFQKALDSHPELPEPHVYLAQALWEMGEIDRALSHLKDAEQLAPKDPKIKSMAKSIREKKG